MKNCMFKKIKIDTKQAEELFEDGNKVLEMIASLKWRDDFVCRKCGNSNFCKGKTPYSRRCTRCKSEESATAHTIFHNIKFPINKAFYIAYNECVLKKDVSTYCYAEELGINQMTCWRFRKRIQDCITQKDEKGKVDMRSVLMTKIV